jgi:hypothetical protein
VTDADHEEFHRKNDEPWGADVPAYMTIGYSDKVHWDLAGHVYVNDVRACCRHWWSRLWRRATGDHV